MTSRPSWAPSFMQSQLKQNKTLLSQDESSHSVSFRAADDKPDFRDRRHPLPVWEPHRMLQTLLWLHRWIGNEHALLEKELQYQFQHCSVFQNLTN